MALPSRRLSASSSAGVRAREGLCDEVLSGETDEDVLLGMVRNDPALAEVVERGRNLGWRRAMRNLAGVAECDLFIAEELRRSMIPSTPCDLDRHSEVPSRLRGELGPLTFQRAWTYWIARGPVPLGIAWPLYNDPIGRTDIRIAGHCGCPAPEAPWVDRIDGREYVMSYHIDTEVGLRLFADAVRNLT